MCMSILTDLGMARNSLPDGWVEIPHYSGAPVYFHKETRVCSCSRPYHVPSQLSVRVRRLHVFVAWLAGQQTYRLVYANFLCGTGLSNSTLSSTLSRT